jgi:hypothetical protein
MKIYITLDYELFFGSHSGSVDNCIIKPTEALLKLVDPFDIKLNCFVDSGYLIALEKFKTQFPQLEEEYQKITQQIYFLSANNHGIELHIHPHWEDTNYDGENWVFNTNRYKLSDFSSLEVMEIATRYNEVLKRISGKSPVAYRAGGWSAQPFKHIKDALIRNNIKIDSTVYPGGHYFSANQVFDFRKVDKYKTYYKFSNDLTIEDKNGSFTEIPISSYKVPPSFYWQFAVTKFMKNEKHLAYGDGNAIKLSKKGLFKLLTTYSNSVVSIDGYKSSYLEKAFKDYKAHTNNKGNFVIIGHPKAFTPFSLRKVADFLSHTHKENSFQTFR